MWSAVVAVVFWFAPLFSSVLLVSVGDADTGAFISDADVRLPLLNRSVRTKWNGEASFVSLTPGRYRVQVRAVGYAPGDLEIQVSGDSMGVHFALERNPTALDTMRVVAEGKPALGMREFEARRKLGVGRFLTDSMLKEDRSQSMQWVLATRVPGIKVRKNGIMATQPSGFAGDNDCPILVYYDGFQVESVDREPLKLVLPNSGGGRSGTLVSGAPPSIGGKPPREIPELDRIRPEDIAGVEIYSQSTAPAQYRPMGNYCKVVLLWTKW